MDVNEVNDAINATPNAHGITNNDVARHLHEVGNTFGRNIGKVAAALTIVVTAEGVFTDTLSAGALSRLVLMGAMTSVLNQINADSLSTTPPPPEQQAPKTQIPLSLRRLMEDIFALADIADHNDGT